MLPPPVARRATLQATGNMTNTGFAMPPPRPMAQPVAAPAPAAEVPAEAEVAAPLAAAAEAFEAPKTFAADPFPAEVETRTFDAEDFEAADDFLSAPEAAPAAAVAQGDLEDEDFAPELELADKAPVEPAQAPAATVEAAQPAPAEIQYDPKGNFRIGIEGDEIVAVINGKAIKGKRWQDVFSSHGAKA